MGVCLSCLGFAANDNDLVDERTNLLNNQDKGVDNDHNAFGNHGHNDLTSVLYDMQENLIDVTTFLQDNQAMSLIPQIESGTIDSQPSTKSTIQVRTSKSITNFEDAVLKSNKLPKVLKNSPISKEKKVAIKKIMNHLYEKLTDNCDVKNSGVLILEFEG